MFNPFKSESTEIVTTKTSARERINLKSEKTIKKSQSPTPKMDLLMRKSDLSSRTEESDYMQTIQTLKHCPKHSHKLHSTAHSNDGRSNDRSISRSRSKNRDSHLSAQDTVKTILQKRKDEFQQSKLSQGMLTASQLMVDPSLLKTLPSKTNSNLSPQSSQRRLD